MSAVPSRRPAAHPHAAAPSGVCSLPPARRSGPCLRLVRVRTEAWTEARAVRCETLTVSVTSGVSVACGQCVIGRQEAWRGGRPAPRARGGRLLPRYSPDSVTHQAGAYECTVGAMGVLASLGSGGARSRRASASVARSAAVHRRPQEDTLWYAPWLEPTAWHFCCACRPACASAERLHRWHQPCGVARAVAAAAARAAL